jgi:hypothetical protein
MPCNDPKLREELLNKILLQNDKYTRELVERAITSCCAQNTTDIETCVTMLARQLYLMDYKPGQ